MDVHVGAQVLWCLLLLLLLPVCDTSWLVSQTVTLGVCNVCTRTGTDFGRGARRRRRQPWRAGGRRQCCRDRGARGGGGQIYLEAYLEDMKEVLGYHFEELGHLDQL